MIESMLPKKPAIETERGTEQIFDEMKTIALGFVRRTEAVETQLNHIIATVYTNLKRQHQDGLHPEFVPMMVTWMDVEIAKLKDLRERYLVEVAARPVVKGDG